MSMAKKVRKAEYNELPSATEEKLRESDYQRELRRLHVEVAELQQWVIVIFDRSWRNRAGVERVMGFCPEEQVKRFLQLTPAVEKAIIEPGIILLKYWLEVSQE